VIAHQPSSGTGLGDLKLIFSGRHADAPVEFWDGNLGGVVTDPTNFTSTANNVLQEAYPMANSPNAGARTIAERVPGEYWLFSPVFSNNPAQDGTANLWKGEYDENTQSINWSIAWTLIPDHTTDPLFLSSVMAFSPDGNDGIAAWLGDVKTTTGIPSGGDSVLTIVYSETDDGGATWGPVEEIDMITFDNLRDSLQSFWIQIDTTTNDTLPYSRGIPTTGFDLDATVDANGNPHLITFVSTAQINTSDGTPFPDTLGAYSLISNARNFVYDFTRDRSGGWNGLFIGAAKTFRGSFGNIDPVTGQADLSLDVYTKVSRSPDGTKLFFSYTDTDTTNNFRSNDNDFPNLIGRVYDVNKDLISADSNWTAGDPSWGGRAYTPTTAPVALDNGNGTFTVPTMFMDFADPLATTNVWYISDITYDESDIKQIPSFLSLCANSDLDGALTVTEPSCGNNDGQLAVNSSGGFAPYSFLWTGPNVDGFAAPTLPANLAPGEYAVEITDAQGCTSIISVTLESDSAADVTIEDPLDVACAGDSTGSAIAVTDGGTAPFTFSWSNGEAGDTARALSVGLSTVEVTDANNCVSFAQVEIDEPTPITVSTLLDGQVSCAGDADGEVFVEGRGGTGTLSYTWSDGTTGQTLIGQPAGTYSVTITDANGCETTAEATVEDVASLVITPFEAQSNSQNDGAIGIAIDSIGNGPGYTFTARLIESNGETQDTVLIDREPHNSTSDDLLLGLCGGTYEVLAEDVNGCTAVDTVIITGNPCGFATSIQGADLAALEVFPNPSQGEVQVNLSLNQAHNLKVELFDAQGQVIERRQVEGVLDYRARFDLSGQARGIYLLRFTTPVGIETRRIMLN